MTSKRISGTRNPGASGGGGGLRAAQKLRTQRRLLAAARIMMERGEPVTVATAAAEAGISVATAYRYYSEAETLRTDAALDLNMGPQGDFIGELERAVQGIPDPRQRVLIAQHQMLEFVFDHEPSYRLFVAKGHEQRVRDVSRLALTPRGGRRRLMLEAALRLIEPQMGAARWQELILALMIVTGPEPYFTLSDFVGLSREEVLRINDQAVLDVMDAHLARAGLATPA